MAEMARNKLLVVVCVFALVAAVSATCNIRDALVDLSFTDDDSDQRDSSLCKSLLTDCAASDWTNAHVCSSTCSFVGKVCGIDKCEVAKSKPCFEAGWEARLKLRESIKELLVSEMKYISKIHSLDDCFITPFKQFVRNREAGIPDEFPSRSCAASNKCDRKNFNTILKKYFSSSIGTTFEDLFNVLEGISAIQNNLFGSLNLMAVQLQDRAFYTDVVPTLTVKDWTDRLEKLEDGELCSVADKTFKIFADWMMINMQDAFDTTLPPTNAYIQFVSWYHYKITEMQTYLSTGSFNALVDASCLVAKPDNLLAEPFQRIMRYKMMLEGMESVMHLCVRKIPTIQSQFESMLNGSTRVAARPNEVRSKEDKRDKTTLFQGRSVPVVVTLKSVGFGKMFGQWTIWLDPGIEGFPFSCNLYAMPQAKSGSKDIKSISLLPCKEGGSTKWHLEYIHGNNADLSSRQKFNVLDDLIRIESGDAVVLIKESKGMSLDKVYSALIEQSYNCKAYFQKHKGESRPQCGFEVARTIKKQSGRRNLLNNLKISSKSQQEQPDH